MTMSLSARELRGAWVKLANHRDGLGALTFSCEETNHSFDEWLQQNMDLSTVHFHFIKTSLQTLQAFWLLINHVQIHDGEAEATTMAFSSFQLHAIAKNDAKTSEISASYYLSSWELCNEASASRSSTVGSVLPWGYIPKLNLSVIYL